MSYLVIGLEANNLDFRTVSTLASNLESISLDFVYVLCGLDIDDPGIPWDDNKFTRLLITKDILKRVYLKYNGSAS